MEKEKEKIELRCHSKICPTCHEEFSETEHVVCPEDESLLCPVGENPLIGEHVSGFEIVSIIGTGSSSSVYLAKTASASSDSESKGKMMVAVKVLHANLLSDPVAVKRFQLEAQLVNSLDHPNIAAVLAFGVLSDGRPYLILEHLEGVTLKDLLGRETKLTSERACKIFIDVIDALEAAHQKGILHRDVKPGNIIFDRLGSIKIVDFGIAKVSGIENATVTLTGASVGTPAYMSPEQCLGQEEDVRSDIYSLGCLMYECLSGKKVFPAESAFSCMRQHTFCDPVPLSELVPEVTRQIAASVMRCLEKEPAHRFQSMSELRSALLGELPVPLKKKRARSVKRGGSGIGTKWAPYLIPLLLAVSLLYMATKNQQLPLGEQYVASLPSVPSSPTPPTGSVPSVDATKVEQIRSEGGAAVNESEPKMQDTAADERNDRLSDLEEAELDRILSKVNSDSVWTKAIKSIRSVPSAAPTPLIRSVPSAAPTPLTNQKEGSLTPPGDIDSTISRLKLPVFAGVRSTSGKDWYLLARDGVMHFDPATEKSTSLPVPRDLPDMQFCTGITCDTKRNRILVIAENFLPFSNTTDYTALYSYEPTSKKWSWLAKIRKLSLNGLAYSKSDDKLYTLAFEQTPEYFPKRSLMYKMSPDGKDQGFVPMSRDPLRFFSTLPPTLQLDVNDRLLIMYFDSSNYCVIDRNTGQVLRREPQTNARSKS